MAISTIKLDLTNDGKFVRSEQDTKGYYNAILIEDLSFSNLSVSDLNNIITQRKVTNDGNEKYPAFLFYDVNTNKTYVDFANIFYITYSDAVNVPYPSANTTINSIILADFDLETVPAEAYAHLEIRTTDGSSSYYINFNKIYPANSPILTSSIATISSAEKDDVDFTKIEVTNSPINTISTLIDNVYNDKLLTVKDTKSLIISSINAVGRQAYKLDANTLYYRNKKYNASARVQFYKPAISIDFQQTLPRQSTYIPADIITSFDPVKQIQEEFGGKIIDAFFTVSLEDLSGSSGKGTKDDPCGTGLSRTVIYYNGGVDIIQASQSDRGMPQSMGMTFAEIEAAYAGDANDRYGEIMPRRILPSETYFDNNKAYAKGVGIWQSHTFIQKKYHGCLIQSLDDVYRGKIVLSKYKYLNMNIFTARFSEAIREGAEFVIPDAKPYMVLLDSFAILEMDSKAKFSYIYKSFANYKDLLQENHHTTNIIVDDGINYGLLLFSANPRGLMKYGGTNSVIENDIFSIHTSFKNDQVGEYITSYKWHVTPSTGKGDITKHVLEGDPALTSDMVYRGLFGSSNLIGETIVTSGFISALKRSGYVYYTSQPYGNSRPLDYTEASSIPCVNGCTVFSYAIGTRE